MASSAERFRAGRPAAVSFVVLNWNGKEILAECLDSIQSIDYPLHQIIISDNGSTDGSIEMVRERYPRVTLIENGSNYGVAIARNIGLRRAVEGGAEFVYCLDNDLIIHPQAVKNSLEVFEIDHRIAMVGSLILDKDTPDVILSAGGMVNWTQNLVATLGMNSRDTGQFRGFWDVDYAGGGAVLIRGDYIKAHGGVDEGFVGYGYEDTDYGMRAKRLAYRVVCCADARVWHRPHSSIGRYTFRKKYLETRNAVRLIRRYGRAHHWCKYLAYLIPGFFYALVREGARGNIGGVLGKMRGFVDGLRDDTRFAHEMLDGRQSYRDR